MELWLQAILFGLVQGLTEYLPISSTGHVRISAAFLGVPDPGAAFSAVTQLGTALAVAIYFRTELKRITWVALGKSKNAEDVKLLRYMAVATVPIVLVGFSFASFFQSSARDLRLIAWALIVFGIILFVADKYSKNDRIASQLTIRDALLIGGAQTLALIPGVSRSGATMTMGRFLGLNRIDAARISFLLSLPAIILAAIYEMRYIGQQSLFDWPLTLLAAAIAFISGYLTIEFMLRWLASHSFLIFSVYRIVLGISVLSALYFFGLDPIG